MRRFAILFSVGLLALLALATSAFAQDGLTVLPTVVTFSADLPAIALADAEAGTTPVTLRWTTYGLQPGQRLVLEAYSLHQWVSLVDGGETLESSDDRTLFVEHPLNFGPPTYRLSIVGADGATVDQRVLTIPYLAPAADAEPDIVEFTSSAGEVTPGENGVAVLPVTWQVAGRLPSSYLAFNQILPDGQIVAIDLPRATLWVPSSGEGAVAPTVPAGATTVTLLLRVVDAGTDQTYASRELTLPVAGTSAPEPVTPTPEVTAAPPAEPSADASIFYFQPTLTGTAGDGQFALVWDVAGAPAVQIEYIDAAGNPVIRSGLKPTGDLIIALAEVGAAPEPGRYQFTLTATDANGLPLAGMDGAPVAQTVEIPAETAMTINSFATTATSVTPGETIGLTWDVTGAENITLSRLSVQTGSQLFSQVIGEALPPAGSLQFTMPEIAGSGFFGDQVTFMLMAEDATSANRVAYIRLPINADTVTVDTFELSRRSAMPGNEVTLTWTTTGATSVDVLLLTREDAEPQLLAEAQPANGSFSYTFPTEADPAAYGQLVSFILDVTGEDGTTKQATNNLQFSTSGLSIALFTADPTNVAPGGTVSLAWDVTGASRVSLAQHNPSTGVMATIADNLPLAGSLQIAVPAEIAADQLPLSTGFVLRAENVAGDMHTQDALITITAP